MGRLNRRERGEVRLRLPRAMEAGLFVAAAALTSWTATAAIHDQSKSTSPNGPTIGTVLHDVEVWWQKERADAEK
jgi:hypothetical protein